MEVSKSLHLDACGHMLVFLPLFCHLGIKARKTPRKLQQVRKEQEKDIKKIEPNLQTYLDGLHMSPNLCEKSDQHSNKSSSDDGRTGDVCAAE